MSSNYCHLYATYSLADPQVVEPYVESTLPTSTENPHPPPIYTLPSIKSHLQKLNHQLTLVRAIQPINATTLKHLTNA